MAVVKVEKFNLISFKEDLNPLLKQLQEFTEVDFRVNDFELESVKSVDKDEIENTVYNIENVIKKLKKYTPSKSAYKSLKEGKKEFTYDELENYVKDFNVFDIVNNVNEILSKKESLERENDILLNEISEFSKWEKLDIVSSDIKNIRQVDVFIGTMSVKNFERFKLEDLSNVVLEIIYEDKKEVNFLIVSNKEDSIYDKLRVYNFNKIGFNIDKSPTLRKEENLDRIKQNSRQISDYEENLKSLANNFEDLQISYEYYKNLLLKEDTKELFKNTDNLNVITGYIPENRKEEFISKIEKVCNKNYYLSSEEFDVNSSEVPIKLENAELIKPFELLISTYALPKYTEIDPTIVVAPFFWIFFGMMLADFGYGMVVTLVSLLTLKFFKIDKTTRSIFKFGTMLGVSTMIWGALYGSIFGFNFPNPIHYFSPTQDYKPVMFISIGIGVIHILLALAVKAYILIRTNKPLDALFDVGFWVVALFSIGFYLAGYDVAKYPMIIFMVLIVATGGRHALSLGGKVGMGVYALYGISGYLGDLISYVRLMALALSGGYIAYAVNMIAAMVGGKGIMIIFMILIMIIGHTFNMLLSILGAYVHTSRLIYVEFFSKFYEGGGKPFKDFKIKEKYINIRE